MIPRHALQALCDERAPLLFPIETFSRELDYRLWLGALMASRGHRVLIGDESAFYRLAQLGVLKGGVYLGKLFSPFRTAERSLYDFYKARGFGFIHLDEEGAVWPGEGEAFDRQLATRIDPHVLDERDHMFTWGDRQRDFYRSLGARCTDHIVTTGHPRFDLYKPPYMDFFTQEADRYRERYGDFLLLNSNLASVNSYRSGVAFYLSEKLGMLAEADHYSQVTSRWRSALEQLADFVEVAFALSERYPERQIVIRPHPSEDHYLYNQAFAGRDNVHVVYEGAIGAWLVACSAMVHYNCTTAIEASLLNKPVINFCKRDEDGFSNYLPNSLGLSCRTERQVFDVLEAYWEDESAYEPALIEPRASKLLYNLEHDSVGAVTERLESIIQEDRAPNRRAPTSAALDLVEQARYRLAQGKYVARRRLGNRGASLFNQKFEGFKGEVIDRKLEALRRVLPARAAAVRTKIHSPLLISMCEV